MASPIASMTMPLSISFSRATASAMASSSDLLAVGLDEGAGAAVAMIRSTFCLDRVGAFGAERRGGVDELVGQDQLGRLDIGKGDLAAALGRLDRDRLAVDPDNVAGDLLGGVDRLDELDPRLMPGPVGVIGAAGERTVDAGRGDFEAIGA